MCTAVTTDGNISNQATEAKLTLHIGFVNFFTAVTDGNIPNQSVIVKMTVHIRFLKLCPAVTTDSDISSQATVMHDMFMKNLQISIIS